MTRWQLSDEERRDLLDFTRRLVRTPSLPGDEGAVAALVMAEMERLGFRDVQADEAGNVFGTVGAETGPLLLFDSHMDTVEPANPQAWTMDPWSGVVRDGRLYGLGSCDMKSGLAATIYGIAHLRRLGLPLRGRVIVAAVVLEEPAEGTGTRLLFQLNRIRPDWVVIAEPSSLHIVRAQRGHLEMTVEVHGRSAHSAAPQLGKNAIYEAARVIFGLELLEEQLPAHPFLGKGVLAVTEISSQAVSRNAIPYACHLFIDRRLTVGETEALALTEVQRVIAREGVSADVRVVEEQVRTYTGHTYTARRASPPWLFDEGHPLIRAAVQAVRNVGLRPQVGRWDFATEGAYTAGVLQIPTVGLGPGDPAMAHTVNESVAVEELYAAASIYAAMAAALLG
jgi:putative selenium metabolism hydrolase